MPEIVKLIHPEVSKCANMLSEEGHYELCLCCSCSLKIRINCQQRTCYHSDPNLITVCRQGIKHCNQYEIHKWNV